MGYAHYDTPMGLAGYAVEDVCHEDGCAVEIDRGRLSLCGNTPGQADEYGCGKWFCEEHLCTPPKDVKIPGGLCNSCILKYDGVDDDE